MTEDKNKGLDKVTYNHLILPKTLVGGGKTIIYIYYANGQKLLKTAPNGTETYYAGNFVYEDDELQYILHSEGKIDMSGGTPVYQFNLKDHLGNVRAMTDLNGNLEQVSSYYPFGMLAEDASLSGANNKYRYNGKELQDDAIGNGQLDWYDYGARFYDPALGRFHTQDRFSEKYYSLSNYQYAANNPILNIDVNGDSIRINYGNNQELLYTPGMKYSGNDKFVSQTVDYLNNINSVKGGNKLIGKLNSSTDDYKFINKTPVDKKGNQLSGTFQFKGNSNDGGGTILAGEFKNSKISGFAKVEGSAHELFHGYQHSQGQGGGSIMNEFEAHLFGFTTAEEWAYSSNYIGALSGTNMGTNTPTGSAYETAFKNLQSGFSLQDYKTGVKSFVYGYQKGYEYKNRVIQRANQKKVLIKSFYPLR